MQPLYATLLSYPKQYATALDNRLWKQNVLQCYAGLAFVSRLWKWLANSPPIYGTVLATVLEQFSGKQSSPSMELLGQLCLTTWATVSYYLGNYVLLLGQLCLTTWATVSYYLGNCVLLLGQLCLTTWATVSYCLWKCLRNSPPIYRTVLGTVLEQLANEQSSPFMEMVCNRLSSYLPCYTTAYGNGISPPKIPRTAVPILKKG
jgi:hypothetical protein